MGNGVSPIEKQGSATHKLWYSMLNSTLLQRTILYVTSLWLLSAPVSAYASSNMTFNKPVDTPQARYVIELMDLAYDQLGYQLELIEFDQPQALRAADEGTLDGQLGRIAAIESRYANLVRVDFPLFKFELIMLTRCAECQLNDLNSVVLRSGYPVAEQYLDSQNYQGRRLSLKSVSAQLNLLAQRQVDGIAILDFHLKQAFDSHSNPSYHRQHLNDYYSYHYVHKRHEALIPELLAVLNTLKQNGVVDYLKQKHGL